MSQPPGLQFIAKFVEWGQRLWHLWDQLEWTTSLDPPSFCQSPVIASFLLCSGFTAEHLTPSGSSLFLS